MTQKVSVEIHDNLSTAHADHLANLLRDVAAADGLTRLHLEIEADTVLGLAALPSTDAVEPPSDEPAAPDDDAEPAEPEPEEEEEEEADEEDEEATDDQQQWPPTLNPGTRKWTLAAMLYAADDPLTVRDVVEQSDSELSQSVVSAGLYNMFQEDLVDRDGSPFAYELAEDAVSLLEERADEEGVPITPEVA